MAKNNTYYDLPQDAYLGFDAQNLKKLIIQQLNKGGVYTDQEYEGSNFSAILDVIAYTYHLLLFYLNRMGTESTFTQTQIYENMNRIVKLLGYNPIGYQTSCVAFKAYAPDNTQNTTNGFELNTTYILPRYAYINVNGIRYTLTNDILFSMTENDDVDDSLNKRLLTEFSNTNILFQGNIIEAPIYTALGEQFETYTLIPSNNTESQATIVDYANFSVFVYNASINKWQEWTETSSLYLENNSTLKYEKRLNENGYYEFRFGNNVNGKQLNAGDYVQIYYLKSDGVAGEIGINQLKDNTLNTFNTEIFNRIMIDVLNLNSSSNVVSSTQIKLFTFINDTISTKFTEPESIDNIRSNLSKVFHSQSQLITAENIQTYIERNFNNMVSSVYVLNNNDYLYNILSYYNDLGVNSITKESRIAINQLQFATSCNFNNIYVYMVPKYTPVDSNNNGKYVDSNLKQYMVSKLNDLKPLTSEIIPMDPVYIATGFGIQLPTDTIFTSEYSKQTPDEIINETKLVLTRYSNSHIKTSLIKSQACDIIRNMFNQVKLGYTISTIELNNELLNIEGVNNVFTQRQNSKIPGISLMIWNPIYYNKDISTTTNPITFDKFKYPFFYNINNIADYIDIQIAD